MHTSSTHIAATMTRAAARYMQQNKVHVTMDLARSTNRSLRALAPLAYQEIDHDASILGSINMPAHVVRLVSDLIAARYGVDAARAALRALHMNGDSR